MYVSLEQSVFQCLFRDARAVIASSFVFREKKLIVTLFACFVDPRRLKKKLY